MKFLSGTEGFIMFWGIIFLTILGIYLLGWFLEWREKRKKSIE